MGGGCPKEPECARAVRYVAHSRAAAVRQRQEELVSDLGLPVMTIYHDMFLSAGTTIPGDARHYATALNEHLVR